MRKALVVELKKNHAVIAEQGLYLRVTLKEGMEIGRTILFTEGDIVKHHKRTKSKWRQQLVPVMAVLVLVLVLAGGFYNNNYMAYSAVTVDINPSVELLLNKQDKVVRLIPLNSDAETLNFDGLKGLSVDAVVGAIISNAQEEGFIQEKVKSYVVLTTVPLRANSDAAQTSLQVKLREKVAMVVIDKNLSVAVTESTEDLLDEAIAKGLPLAVVNMKNKIDISHIDSVKTLFQNRENHRLFSEDGEIYEVGTDVNQEPQKYGNDNDLDSDKGKGNQADDVDKGNKESGDDINGNRGDGTDENNPGDEGDSDNGNNGSSGGSSQGGGKGK